MINKAHKQKKLPELAAALDAYLASAAIRGDRRAFQLLYKRWHPKLLQFALRLTGHPEDAKDVMQAAAMAMAKNIRRLKDADSFGAWAYTIVRRRASEHIKRTVKRRTVFPGTEPDPDTPAPETDPATLALRDALSALTPQDQTLLKLFYLDGLTGPELAAALGVPIGTIKSRLFAARGRLKDVFETTEGDQR